MFYMHFIWLLEDLMQFWQERKKRKDKRQMIGTCPWVHTSVSVLHEERIILKKFLRENWPWSVSSNFTSWFNGGIRKPLQKNSIDVPDAGDIRLKRMFFVEDLHSRSHTLQIRSGGIVEDEEYAPKEAGIDVEKELWYIARVLVDLACVLADVDLGISIKLALLLEFGANQGMESFKAGLKDNLQDKVIVGSDIHDIRPILFSNRLRDGGKVNVQKDHTVEKVRQDWGYYADDEETNAEKACMEWEMDNKEEILFGKLTAMHIAEIKLSMKMLYFIRLHEYSKEAWNYMGRKRIKNGSSRKQRPLTRSSSNFDREVISKEEEGNIEEANMGRGSGQFLWVNSDLAQENVEEVAVGRERKRTITDSPGLQRPNTRPQTTHL